MRYVFFDLSPEWDEEAKQLEKRLVQEGIFCAGLSWETLSLVNSIDTVVLTDCPESGRRLTRMGKVYFGCCRGTETRWFDGAALVLEGFDDVDGRYLEEWVRWAQGLPAVITRTKRLVIREMAEPDLKELVRISRQNSSEAFNGGEDVCSLERLRAYIKSAYRLQGFGLWSVLYQGKVIGCCGFEPWPGSVSKTESALQEEQLALELQYMLDTPYRRRGIGTEMSRAALEYARDRLGVEKVWLRILPNNEPSLALARKLGFHRYLGGTFTDRSEGEFSKAGYQLHCLSTGHTR
ncbi:MAG: GNAT family N-acetyltransferase [Lachnospiraceae bacterium]|nr:GNAT family N-acetyltransferase [Lachnospiraceae bacterium]